jgi:hypothetical protein
MTGKRPPFDPDAIRERTERAYRESMTPPTPREVPVREAEWPHRPATDSPDTYCDHCDHPWPCPSQRYLDGLVTAVRALPVSQYPMVKGAAVEALVSRDAVRLILEGARATDDEGQR